MNIHTLYKRTDSQRKMLARYVRVFSLKTGYANGLGFVAAKTQSVKRFDHYGHLVPVKVAERVSYVTMITFIDSKLNVKVSCSCGDLTYRWETALHVRWKAADIEYSNGELPNVTNPQMRASLCKHLCALYERVKHRIPE